MLLALFNFKKSHKISIFEIELTTSELQNTLYIDIPLKNPISFCYGER